ncbi:MAG TPA: ATP synthase F0 subunit B [Candidatus Eremiobacteraceae bacterium]|nr:ATP synthase F0 subunit B [Candidatus Eremiobacteraceae bacterium]
MLLSIDGTFLVQILNFVVFWVLLNFVFIAPTRRAIEGRLRLIALQQREAQELRERAAALKAEADSLIDAARRRTDEIMREAAARASAEVHEIERNAGEQAAASIALAHAAVASERAIALEKQGPLVQELGRAMASRAVGLEGAA